MSKAAIATGVLLGALVIFLGYDAYLFLQGGTKATVSWMIYEISYVKPFAIFSAGFVNGLFVGHLFWQMHKPKQEIK